MADRKKPNQAMPDDGLEGAPDGVNSQARTNATGGGDAGAPYPNPHGATKREGKTDGFTGHGGQSDDAYYGSGRLGDEEIAPEGNANAGSSEE